MDNLAEPGYTPVNLLKIEIIVKILWQECQNRLQHELPEQQFNTWIRPLSSSVDEAGQLALIAPNHFVRDWVKDKYLQRIQEILADLNNGRITYASVTVGDNPSIFQRNDMSSNRAKTASPDYGYSVNGAHPPAALTHSGSITFGESASDSEDSPTEHGQRTTPLTANPAKAKKSRHIQVEGGLQHQSYLNNGFTFQSFVEGKSNQLAHAAARQVAENAGGSYNPLFIYGGVGLGKTHLMHAVGNYLQQKNTNARVLYVSSERFVQDMVKALQLNAINEFKRFYRGLDALLIDDIQFFAGKERSQEEFFHTFNALLEGGQQMILTCDRYPKEIQGLEERLKSRFGWGLTVAVEPPELETRVAILMKKAEESGVNLSGEAAFFIAQKIRSNVRELEGALKRVAANSHFTNSEITIPFIKEALKDLLALQDRQISIDNIQRTVAEYYKLKLSDLLSKRRTRSIARPRQVAMALSKELTNHSLPEIGDAFGGRDHTTVLHACRKIKELQETTADVREDYKNLLRSLTT